MEVTTEVAMEVTAEVKRLVSIVLGDHSRKELQEMLWLKHAEYFCKAYLLPATDISFSR